jgi:hypothetical protein
MYTMSAEKRIIFGIYFAIKSYIQTLSSSNVSNVKISNCGFDEKYLSIVDISLKVMGELIHNLFIT